jgi:branched-chain amino acid transport system permease protein
MSTPRYETDYADARRILPGPGAWLSYGLLLGALVVLPFFLPRYYVGEFSVIFIFAIASLGLMLLTGFTGQISLGQGAFVAIGAYVQALLMAEGVPLPVAMLGACLAGAFTGLVIGLPAIRVSGLHLAMVTMALAIIVEHGIGRWKSVTGGHSGLPVPDAVLFGFDLSSPRSIYFLSLVILVLVLLGLVNLMRSPTGRAFVGVRDSEAAARGLGINVERYKVQAFVLSAAISALAGSLMAHQTQYISPEGFGLALSLQLVLMVMIGGLGSLRGAILGAILIGLLPTFISAIKPLLPARIGNQVGLEIFIYGAVLVFFVLLEPKGLNGRWLKVRAFFESFPLYRRSTYRRTKTYMRSERYR